ncbi:hypothetical protein [Actinoplanes sp. NPDC051411]|uniref:hypothetical protein n=1 Tax=Actinoplanes sp. NPDC051411 TaxID=3155522 RepID=UPI00342A839E
MHKLSVALVAGAALMGAGAIATPASAAGTEATAAAAGTAPACIGRDVHSVLEYVTLSNNCGKTMQVKVIIDAGSDSPCYRMGSGSSVTYWYGGIYNRTVVC